MSETQDNILYLNAEIQKALAAQESQLSNLDKFRDDTHHEDMSATTDKNYIDSRLETIAAKLSGDAATHQVKVDARLESMNETLKSGLKSIQEEMGTKLAQIGGANDKAHTELLKWTAGAIFTGVAVSVSLLSFVLSRTSEKPAPQPPVMIYAQPPQPMVAPTSRAGPPTATPTTAAKH